jgi:glycosyltransferase involved in cell wall biosynthesis
MRILWLSNFIPYPIAGGSHQRSYHLMRQAAQRHQVTLYAFNLVGMPADMLEAARAEFSQFCEDVEFWPLPMRWKGWRWWGEVAASAVHGESPSLRVFASASFASRVRQHLARGPALVHVDSIDLAAFVRLAAGHRTVLHHHNCESAMAVRRAEHENNPAARVYLRRYARALESLERRLAPVVDGNVAVSSLDADRLRTIAPGAHTHVVDNGTDDGYFVPQPGVEETGTIVFAGSLNWYPNVSGVRRFAERVWPRLKARVPAVRWLLAGMRPVAEVRRLAESDPQITLVDTPPDIRPSMARGAVVVCPIQEGGGTRLKLLDAMAMGKAVVSTAVGAEGLAIVPGRDMLIATDEEDFAAQIETVLRDGALRARIGGAARAMIEARYSWRSIGAALDEAYDCAYHGRRAVCEGDDATLGGARVRA